MKRNLYLLAITGALVFALAGLTGCEGLEELFGGGDPEDGRLTVSVAGVPMDMCGAETEDKDIFFAALVYNAGSLIDSGSSDGWVALVGEMVADGAASGTAFVVGDDNRPEWKGSGGEEYDIYPRVYCVTFVEDGPPTKNGAYFFTQDSEYVFRSIDWQWYRYEQDGNERLDTTFNQYAVR